MKSKMDYNIYLLSIQDKITREDYLNLKLKFEQLQNKEQILSNLTFLKIENPVVPMIASIICGFFSLGWLAIDRFLIKDFALGILRVVLSLLPVIIFFSLAVAYENDEDTSTSFLALMWIFVFFGMIWWLIDLFLVYKKVKQQNYNKIVEFIFLSKYS